MGGLRTHGSYERWSIAIASSYDDFILRKVSASMARLDGALGLPEMGTESGVTENAWLD
jgi:hypothetical protein